MLLYILYVFIEMGGGRCIRSVQVDLWGSNRVAPDTLLGTLGTIYCSG